jgi:hypothetical protein
MIGSRVRFLYESGYLKSLFILSDYKSPEEMEEDISRFAKTRHFIETSIQKINEEVWRLIFVEEVEVKETVPRKVLFSYTFHIILHGQIWEFHTNERGWIVDRILRGLIEFLPKLEHKFVPPFRVMSLAKEYETDELLAFTAKRDYFSLERASSEFKVVGDEVNLTLRSTPEKIWDHYHVLVEEEPVGPLSIGSIQMRIILGDKTCNLWINTSGEILQTAGSREIFFDVRERLLNSFEQEMKWEKYIPLIESRIVEDKEKAITIRGPKVWQKGRPFFVRLSKPFKSEEYEKLKGIFILNARKSGFVGVVEQEEKDRFFVARTTDTKGGGDAMITANVGHTDITIDPLPFTKIRTLEKIYRIILEKFDAKALLVEPQG